MEYIELRAPGEDRTPAPWYCGPDFVGARCWPSYKKNLRDQGYSETEIALIDSQTTKLIQSFEPPTRPDFFVELVPDWCLEIRMACMAGVIAKAIDVGYSTILVVDEDGELDHELKKNEFSSVRLLKRKDVPEHRFGSNAGLILNVSTGSVILGRNPQI